MSTETATPSRPDEREAGQRTIAGLWRRATASPRTNAAYMAETESGWEEVSWAEAARRVDELANGFGRGRGLKDPDERFMEHQDSELELAYSAVPGLRRHADLSGSDVLDRCLELFAALSVLRRDDNAVVVKLPETSDTIFIILVIS